jgi:hypothetical protein
VSSSPTKVGASTFRLLIVGGERTRENPLVTEVPVTEKHRLLEIALQAIQHDLVCLRERVYIYVCVCVHRWCLSGANGFLRWVDNVFLCVDCFAISNSLSILFGALLNLSLSVECSCAALAPLHPYVVGLLIRCNHLKTLFFRSPVSHRTPCMLLYTNT